MAAPRLNSRACALVLAAAALLTGVGQGIKAVVDVHTAHTVSLNNRQDRLFACLERRLHAQVPPGTAVAIGRNISLYGQRLVEWSTPALRVRPDARDAAAVLTVRAVGGGPCDGADVVVHRLPATAPR